MPSLDLAWFESIAALRDRSPPEAPPRDNAAPRVSRRALALGALAVVGAAFPLRAPAQETARRLRIGYQKSGTLAVLKEKPDLARRLAAARVELQWVEFQSGPPLLEALNAGSIDMGYAGDTPPIFAQAAGAKIVYAGYLANPGRNLGILVKEGSGIADVAGLKGRRVAFTKGSSANNFIVKALATAGLAYGDIRPAHLQPADASAAFRAGSVDAWVIWDPFFAQAQRDASVRLLTTAEGVAPSNCFVLAARDYAAREGAIVEAAVRDIDDASRWSEAHQDAVAQIIAGLTGVDIATERVTVARSAYGVAFLDDAVIAQQQEIADTFHRLGLIPRAVDVRQAVWRPLGHAASAVR